MTGPDLQQALRQRVQHWQKEVDIHIDSSSHGAASVAVAETEDLHDVKLERVNLSRSRRRPGLREISVNKAPVKRKFAEVMDRKDDPDEQAEPGNGRQVAKRGRGTANVGRPRGRPSKRAEAPRKDEALPEDNAVIPGDSVSAAGSKSSTSSRTSKPVKGVMTIHQARPDSGITFAYLAQCDPPVRRLNLEMARKEGIRIPDSVIDLYHRLSSVPLGTVPSALVDQYQSESNTPGRHKPYVDDSWRLPAHRTPFPNDRLQSMKEAVAEFLKKAEDNDDRNCIERQWGALAHLIMHELERPMPGVDVLNTENCAIEPLENRPTQPDNSEPIALDDEVSAAASSKQGSKGGELASVGRMVDWSVAMELRLGQKRLLEDAYMKVPGNLKSVNQTQRDYLKNCPLAVDVEVKRKGDPRDPLVQLAIWKASAWRKFRRHHWDTTFPMPGIYIDGHAWEWVIFWGGQSGELNMAGARPFGSTADVIGIWTILYRLEILFKWVDEEYRTWFEANIMAWARKLAGRDESRWSDLEQQMPMIIAKKKEEGQKSNEE